MSLHFIMAGRELVEAVEMTEALTLAIHKRPSADAQLFYRETDGEIMISLPWPTEEVAKLKIATFTHAVVRLHRLLCEGGLKAYVQNPTNGAYLRIPRIYWHRHPLAGPYELLAVEDATGWDDAMVGCPILVAAEDMAEWGAAADVAVAEVARWFNQTPAPEPAPKKRNRADTPSARELRSFLRLADENEAYRNLSGPTLLDRYHRWAAKPGKASPVGRSRFYEILAEHRGQ